MGIASGTRLGPYEVIAPLGSGGMGEVYRARDARLDRDVAVKVLPGRLSDDFARFQREAKAVAALSHPNILSIFDFGRADGVAFVVTELLEGETLREHLADGAIPPRKAIEYALQIAAGLAAAHDKGIVHRDLKPENVFLVSDGRIKILDFGLARQGFASAGDETRPPAIAQHTLPGTVLGTVGYMSPEQVRGQLAGPPSDIFSFGAVLYEMVTGGRAFTGDSAAETMHAILKEDPHDIAAARKNLPRSLERILLHCLEKRPEQRFQTARDLGFALEALTDLSAPRMLPTISLSGLRWRMPVWLALSIVLLAGGIGWWAASRSDAERSVTLRRLTADSGLTTDAAISLDGKLVAYASDRAGGNLDIWVQQTSGEPPARLTTDGADDTSPSFSPDGSKIVFRSERDGGGIYVVPTLGGTERLVARHGNWPRFSPDGSKIAFIGWGGRTQYLTIVASSGAEAREFPGIASNWVPLWAPDGRHVIIQGCQEAPPKTCDFYVVETDSSGPANFVATGGDAWLARHSLRLGSSYAASGAFFWSGDRILLSAANGDSINLYEARVSLKSFRFLEAPPRRLTTGTEEEEKPSVDSSGRLVFSAGSSSTDLWELPLDANKGTSGREPHRLTGDIASDSLPTLSDDGRMLAFLSTRVGNQDVWLRNLESDRESALTTTAEDEWLPVISHDGARVAYAVRKGAKLGVLLVSTDGGAPERLCDTCGAPTDWSHDGRTLLFQFDAASETRRFSAGVLDVRSRKVTEIVASREWLLFRGHFSPDDKWIVFHAYSSKGARVIIVPFRGHHPISENEWIVAADERSNNDAPRWSPDGNLIYYVSDSDGFQCISAQRLDPTTKKPVGESFVVQHFHGHQRSLAVHPNWFDLALARDKIIFNMAERRGNVWTADFK